MVLKNHSVNLRSCAVAVCDSSCSRMLSWRRCCTSAWSTALSCFSCEERSRRHACPAHPLSPSCRPGTLSLTSAGTRGRDLLGGDWPAPGVHQGQRGWGEHLAYSFLSLSFTHKGYQDSCYLGEMTSSSIQTQDTMGGARETELGQTHELSERTPSPHTPGVNSDAGRRCVSNKAST